MSPGGNQHEKMTLPPRGRHGQLADEFRAAGRIRCRHRSKKATARGPAPRLRDSGYEHAARRARVDESDRGRLRVAQTGTVRMDAVPDKEFAEAWKTSVRLPSPISTSAAAQELRHGVSVQQPDRECVLE